MYSFNSTELLLLLLLSVDFGLQCVKADLCQKEHPDSMESSSSQCKALACFLDLPLLLVHTGSIPLPCLEPSNDQPEIWSPQSVAMPKKKRTATAPIISFSSVLPHAQKAPQSFIDPLLGLISTLAQVTTQCNVQHSWAAPSPPPFKLPTPAPSLSLLHT
ncbi:hypothetical protein DNTS_003475 [Danionella cerebrum]|uniref:Uncharacterized protein n=1 Tax=Danionella cerebrum TaxID=2873325 RepID=A0A553QHA4_9TELE|nr:hypothetical protein DNTS_003475 [Danionella translucida]